MDAVTAGVIGDIALVIVVSTLLGAAARRCGQPTVIGAILTGVVLGPSLLGRLPGHLTATLFPPQVLPYLTVLSQIAVVIFMFAVGYEIEFGAMRGHGRAVPLVAASGVCRAVGSWRGFGHPLPFSGSPPWARRMRAVRSCCSWGWPARSRPCRCSPRSFASGAWREPGPASSRPRRRGPWMSSRGWRWLRR